MCSLPTQPTSAPCTPEQAPARGGRADRRPPAARTRNSFSRGPERPRTPRGPRTAAHRPPQRTCGSGLGDGYLLGFWPAWPVRLWAHLLVASTASQPAARSRLKCHRADRSSRDHDSRIWPLRTRERENIGCHAAYGLRTRRRRSRDCPSLVSPPQMPCLIEFASAYSRHWARTGHRVHTAAAFASRISRSCGPSPSGPKNSPASLPTQAALSCQLTPQPSRPTNVSAPGSVAVLPRPQPPLLTPFCAARKPQHQGGPLRRARGKGPRPVPAPGPPPGPRAGQILRPGHGPRWPVAPAPARQQTRRASAGPGR